MRTTVGPLPSAVYWRRRAVVLGAVLLGIIVLFVSCTGNDKKDQRGPGASATGSPTPTTTGGTPTPEPSLLETAPPNEPSLPAPGDLQSPGTDGDDPISPNPSLPTLGDGNGNGSGQNTNVEAPTSGDCADSEIAVTPTSQGKSVKRGATLDIGMKIKNIGTRACARDVGADPQELYLDQGARKYWSSDQCNTDKSKNVRTLQPGEELNYKVTWNGRQSSDCAGNVASGPNPPPGQFELRARLGTLHSDPLALTIVG